MAESLVVVRRVHRDLSCQVEDLKLAPAANILLESRGHGLLLRAVLPGPAGSFDEAVIQGKVGGHGGFPFLYTYRHTSSPSLLGGSILDTAAVDD